MHRSTWGWWSVAALLAVGACAKAPPLPLHRVVLHRNGGSTFELVPTEGQLPYCLAWTVAEKGPTRQLTMSNANVSFSCPAGRPIGGHTWRAPVEDGAVRVLVLFTDLKVNAASVSTQIVEASDPMRLTAMELRLPGKAALETLDFSPEQDVAPEVGTVLGRDAGALEAPHTP
jgi:hypothetical protein